MISFDPRWLTNDLQEENTTRIWRVTLNNQLCLGCEGGKAYRTHDSGLPLE
jgi:hypothetical protein